MEIEKGETSTQVPTIEFADQTGSDISLWVEEHHKQGQSVRQLYVDVETDYFKFTQEDIKTLLPYLQSFAETGQLELQETTLQGGESPVSEVNLIKASAQMNYKIYDLKNLLREWRKYGQSSWQSMDPHHLINLTNKILGDE